MKKYLILVVLAVISFFIVVFVPNLFANSIAVQSKISESIIEQNIIEISEKMQPAYKLYRKNQLVAYISNPNKIDNFLQEHYRKNFEQQFPESKLNFDEDFFIQQEYSNLKLEDVDDKIIDYLLKENSFSILTNEISFANEQGVFAKIFVKNIEDFEVAKKRFLLNFVDEDALKKFENGESTEELKGYGTREISLQVKEKIIINKSYTNPKNVFTNSNQIFEYLCYSDNKERKYYTVEEGDTLEGVAAKNGNMSTKLLVLINPGVLSKTNQILKAGTKINVTYFNSPLLVYVKKENMQAEPINPPTPVYIEDEDIFKGKEIVETKEQSGVKNVLYEEVYINGVLQSHLSKVKSSQRVKEPIQAVIRVGTKIAPDRGTGEYIWPIKSPVISCPWMCYFGHSGLDLISKYEPYPTIFAADTGVVVESGFNGGWGYMVKVDHKNGYQTLYAHMLQASELKVGDIIQRGEPIGIMGSSGYSSGTHLHWEIYENEQRVDPCLIVACETIPRNNY